MATTQPQLGGGYEHPAPATQPGGYPQHGASANYTTVNPATQPMMHQSADYSTVDPHLSGHVTDQVGQLAQHLQGFDKGIGWSLAFFAGACCTLAAGLIASLYFTFHSLDPRTWSPMTYLTAIALCGFGLMLVILDLPVAVWGSITKCSAPMGEWVAYFKAGIYSFALFLTRFTGRGFWYLYLGTQTWVALYDDSINPFFGVIFTAYLVVLGIAAMVKGVQLSRRLEKVKISLNNSRVSPVSFVSPHAHASRDGVSVVHFDDFKRMVNKTEEKFTDEELVYVMNALSFMAEHDNNLSLPELEEWLKGKGDFLGYNLV